MPMRSLQVLVIVAVLYVAAQMLADITALRILSIAGLSVSGGTLIYPITFTLRDLVHKVSSAGIARILIFASAGINLFMALLFWLVAELPADLAVGANKPNLAWCWRRSSASPSPRSWLRSSPS